MNPLLLQSQVKIDQNKNTFNYFPVKSKYTGVTETFGQWLIRQRKLLGLNQTELAQRAGLTKATVSLYEKDAVDQPRFRQLDKLARALNKPPEDVRRAASVGVEDDRYKLPEGVSVSFDSSSHLTDEQKDRIVNVIKTLVAGVRAEQGNSS
jgi:transcriptional regulator with XRE-family HTH domain